MYSILKKDEETRADRYFSKVRQGVAKKSVLHVICIHVLDICSLLTDIQRMIMMTTPPRVIQRRESNGFCNQNNHQQRLTRTTILIIRISSSLITDRAGTTPW